MTWHLEFVTTSKKPGLDGNKTPELSPLRALQLRALQVTRRAVVGARIIFIPFHIDAVFSYAGEATLYHICPSLKRALVLRRWDVLQRQRVRR